MKTSLIIFLLMTGITKANANCQDHYANEIKRLDGMLNPARTTLAVSGATAIAVPVALVATSAAVTAGGIVAAPAAVLGAGVFYAAVEGRKHTLQRTLALLKNAEAGEGKVLAKLLNRIQSKQPSVQQADLAATIVKLNTSNAFCPANSLGKVRVLGFLLSKNLIKKNLGLSTDEQSLLDDEDLQEIESLDQSQIDLG